MATKRVKSNVQLLYYVTKKRTNYNDKSLGSVKSKQDKKDKICSENYTQKKEKESPPRTDKHVATSSNDVSGKQRTHDIYSTIS